MVEVQKTLLVTEQAMSSRILLFSCLTLYISAQPSTLCVWTAQGEFDHLNGLYTLVVGNTHNDNVYWQRNSPSCPVEVQYIEAVESGNKYYWQL